MEQSNNDQANLIKEVSIPIYQARGWLKLLGVLNIINGVFLVLSLFGIIIAWLPIWMGVVLYQAGSSSEQAYFNGDKYSFIKSLNQLKLYFTITGIMTLIGIIFFVIMLVVIFAFGLIATEHFNPEYYY